LPSHQLDFSVEAPSGSRLRHDRPRSDGWDSANALRHSNSTNSLTTVRPSWDNEGNLPRFAAGTNHRHGADPVDMTISHRSLPKQFYSPSSATGGLVSSAAVVLPAQMAQQYHRASPVRAANVPSCVSLSAVDGEKGKQHHYKESRPNVKE